MVPGISTRYFLLFTFSVFIALFGRKEGNVLFNNALNIIFYLRLYGVGHMVKYHSDSERKPAAATWATLSDYQQGFFYMHYPTDRIAYTTAFVTPVVEQWLEREIAQWLHPMKDRSDDPSHHERTLLPWSYISHPALFGVKFVLFVKISQNYTDFSSSLR